jgi:hypothetical protein
MSRFSKVELDALLQLSRTVWLSNYPLVADISYPRKDSSIGWLPYLWPKEERSANPNEHEVVTVCCKGKSFEVFL